jgi:hypothetical protein
VDSGHAVLRWYAKRAKLCGGFQKFVYQNAEITYPLDSPDLVTRARHFAEILMRYDFRRDTGMWGAVAYYGSVVQRFLDTGSPGLMQRVDSYVADEDVEWVEEMRGQLATQDIEQLWRGLAVLPRNYEELCPEWFLPTALALVSSYQGRLPSK